jgi:putative heme-binding domain-containing protein
MLPIVIASLLPSSTFALVVALATPSPIGETGDAAEAWSDPRLPVRDRLVLWLDASRQSDAYAAARRPPPTDGGPLGVWYDASGHGLHALQREVAAQPKLVRAGGSAVVRFDGVDDVLSTACRLGELEQFTLFVVAAPKSNRGGFRALCAANQFGRNDYRTGFNVDLGPFPSAKFDVLNVEGAGFGGAQDLLDSTLEFGEFHTFAVTALPDRRLQVVGYPDPMPPSPQVSLFVDGRAQGSRPVGAAGGDAGGSRPALADVVRVDELSVGARFYSNTSDVPSSTGFLDGDVAEVLLYSWALPDAERESVEKYLLAKQQTLQQALAKSERSHRVSLVTAKHDPVQMLVPGFAVRELPIDLPNVNNVRCRGDGTLVALCYDGDVWLLRRDPSHGSDDVPRVATRFYENHGNLLAPIGMALAPDGYGGHRHGVFVACKQKVVLLADDDGDDVAEREVVVASGWAPAAIQHNVDALGVALAPDGRVFFGLGTADYTNAYLVDAHGDGHYDLASERGTILEVAPDFSSRKVFCTGIRFPVGLAFDRDGELWATDQEGATWLADGNPFDELLHVQRGRHYGFPPRHPKHLPNVVDEPSVFDYAPQHESTCGLCFDDGFGPPRWRGDVLVAGYSRGKLWRTELANSAAGPVARSHLIARLDTLACDVSVTSGGGLLVASHGGLPDWGSGPTGHGKLHQLNWAEPHGPQPLFAWAAGPRELRIAFDRPLDPKDLEHAVEHTRIEFGEAVSAGDRFEVHRPGYAVVERQLAAPRFELPVQSVRLAQHGSTLSIVTDEHTTLAPHALELPWRGGTVDLAYDLNGVDVEWRALDADEEKSASSPNDAHVGVSAADRAWSGWLPHLDLAVARAFTRDSFEHDEAWRRLERPGTTTLRCALDLDDLLRPKVQPGSQLDHTWPDEVAVVEFRSDDELHVEIDGARVETLDRRVVATVKPRHGELVPVVVTLTRRTAHDGGAASAPPRLDVSFHTNEDARPRALELRRFVQPWAAWLRDSTTTDVGAAAATNARSRHPDLANGNWSRGRAVFFGDDAMCSRCHTLRDGTSGAARKLIGPDLSKVWQRDYASLRRDVLEPSATLEPDHLPCRIVLDDGREFAGVARADETRPKSGPDADLLVIGEAGGKETRVHAAQVATREPLAQSIMPAALNNVLSREQLADLFVYLLTPPLEPAPITIDGAPPSRTHQEWERFERALAQPGTIGGAANHARTAAASDSSTPPEPLRVVLVAGPKDHGTDEHDYPAWQERWSKLLSLGDSVEVERADGWPSAQQWSKADTVVIYSANPQWSAARGAELDAFLARGGGLVLLHYAVNGHDAVPELASRIGLAWRDGASKFRHGATDLVVGAAAAEHPITRPFATAAAANQEGIGATTDRASLLHLVDETYWNLEGDPSSITVLMSSVEEGEPRPQLWTRELGRGRVFVSLLGHYRWTFDDPFFRTLLLRAIAWSAHQPEERLAVLATVGARVTNE